MCLCLSQTQTKVGGVVCAHKMKSEHTHELLSVCGKISGWVNTKNGDL
jgi:hypothetical protein